MHVADIDTWKTVLDAILKWENSDNLRDKLTKKFFSSPFDEPRHENEAFRSIFFDKLAESGRPEIAEFVKEDIARLYPLEALSVLASNKSPDAPRFIGEIATKHENLEFLALQALVDCQSFQIESKVEGNAHIDRRAEGAAKVIMSKLLEKKDVPEGVLSNAVDKAIIVFTGDPNNQKLTDITSSCLLALYENLEGRPALQLKTIRAFVEEASFNKRALGFLVRLGEKDPEGVLAALEQVQSDITPKIIEGIDYALSNRNTQTNGVREGAGLNTEFSGAASEQRPRISEIIKNLTGQLHGKYGWETNQILEIIENLKVQQQAQNGPEL